MPDGGNSPEVPKAPRLSDMPDPRKGINDMLARVNQSQKPEAPKSEDTVKQETDMYIGALPPELQASIRGFYRDLAKDIVAFQTGIKGDAPVVNVTPDRVDYYKGRFAEVLDSGLLNPHINPPKKITE